MFAPGEFYHLYNRGTEKRIIFSSKKDHERFLALLYLANSSKTLHLSDYPNATLQELFMIERGELLVDICAYCLMPNHFHLLVRESGKQGISRFMQKLQIGYTMYFNTRYERTGVLFQGKHKARHANKDSYLKYLVSYLHLNPVKLIEPAWKETGIKNQKLVKAYLDSYQYSSYADYCGRDRIQKNIITRSALPEYFQTPLAFEANLAEWLNYGGTR